MNFFQNFNGSLYCSNESLNIQNTTTINNHDPELLNLYKEAIQQQDSHADLVIEMQELLAELNKAASHQKIALLDKILGCFKKVKDLGDNVKGVYKYFSFVYNLLIPVAKSHGIDFPPLPIIIPTPNQKNSKKP